MVQKRFECAGCNIWGISGRIFSEVANTRVTLARSLSTRFFVEGCPICICSLLALGHTYATSILEGTLFILCLHHSFSFLRDHGSTFCSHSKVFLLSSPLLHNPHSPPPPCIQSDQVACALSGLGHTSSGQSYCAVPFKNTQPIIKPITTIAIFISIFNIMIYHILTTTMSA